MKSRTEILVPIAAIQAVPIAVIAWYRLQRYAWYRYSAIVSISHDLKWNQDLTFHVSRHTWAVLALAHGAEISEISRLLGHASTGVTERVYAEKKVVSR